MPNNGTTASAPIPSETKKDFQFLLNYIHQRQKNTEWETICRKSSWNLNKQ